MADIKYECPNDCGGCACHLNPPCTHCVEHGYEEVPTPIHPLSSLIDSVNPHPVSLGGVGSKSQIINLNNVNGRFYEYLSNEIEGLYNRAKGFPGTILDQSLISLYTEISRLILLNRRYLEAVYDHYNVLAKAEAENKNLQGAIKELLAREEELKQQILNPYKGKPQAQNKTNARRIDK